MENDKRSRYIWVAVFIANLGTLVACVFLNIWLSYHPDGFTLSNIEWRTSIILLCTSLFISVIPVLISGSKIRLKNVLGYGIPILLLLPIPYFVWHFYNCTGKFCDLGDIVYIWLFALSSVIFVIFYFVGVYFRRWNEAFSLTLIWLEVIALVGYTLYVLSPYFRGWL